MRLNVWSVLPAVGVLLEGARAAPSARAISPSNITEIMHWVNYFDGRYGIAPKAWSTTLYTNAQRTGDMNRGETQNHYLYAGTSAQVIVPGKNIGDNTGHSYAPYRNFQAAYMAWLCERPEQPPLDGQCGDVLAKTGIVEGGGTSNNAVLTHPQFRAIGCAWTTNPQATTAAWWHGIWVCDLA